MQLVTEVVRRCERALSQEALELRRLFTKPHFRALIETHDSVADTTLSGDTKKVNGANHVQSSPVENHTSQPYTHTPSSGEPPPDLLPLEDEDALDAMPADAIRMVGLRKSPNEPLVS